MYPSTRWMNPLVHTAMIYRSGKIHCPTLAATSIAMRWDCFSHPSLLFSLLPGSRGMIWLRPEFPSLCLHAKCTTPPLQALGCYRGGELIWRQGSSSWSSDTAGIRVYDAFRDCQQKSLFIGYLNSPKTWGKTGQNKWKLALTGTFVWGKKKKLQWQSIYMLQNELPSIFHLTHAFIQSDLWFDQCFSWDLSS